MLYYLCFLAFFFIHRVVSGVVNLHEQSVQHKEYLSANKKANLYLNRVTR